MPEAKAEDDDRRECTNCHDVVTGDFATLYVYGKWNVDRQGFEQSHHRLVCHDCWHTFYDSAKATTYQTDDADELWSILSASNGQLVADLSSFFVPEPCYVRVVDDELEACTVDNNPSPGPGREMVLNPSAEPMDVHDLFLEEVIEDNSDPEYPIYLRAADETPFREIANDVEYRARHRKEE